MTQLQSTVHQLASVSATAFGLGKRGLPKGAEVLNPIFWRQYDDDTLIYDTVWSAERQQLQVFCPKWFDFKGILQNARWTVGDQPRKAGRLTQFSVYDTVTIPCAAPPVALELSTGTNSLSIPFSQADPERYRGRNVLYAQNKDNDLSWVCDWVTAHQRNHGVDAVLLSNNNSETYSSEDLRQALAQIPGIAVADVLDVPLRYGPNPATVTPVGALKFLQRALLNIVRERWLQKARGVLICDIDELVVSRSGQSIFDATAKSIFKYTSFDGEWRYRAPSANKVQHADHIYTADPPARCVNKYCVVPDSFLGRMPWGVHALERVNRRIFPASRAFSLYHCRSISTLWKNARKQPPMEKLHQDKATKDFMQKSFPTTETPSHASDKE
ncbi:hypothetical protein [Roseobacter sp. CCS2]|uniref:hypothetical protein n=1 Tax=Roseobacter sp. CCS2 TaxID=391593 RepID=UPI0000F3E53D|nr:hypothetical protein [Roseobacter sp. CCS2]EBA12465.1 hypothetical protein RCCS2_14249 [Roseobacter sp. CCS2]